MKAAAKALFRIEVRDYCLESVVQDKRLLCFLDRSLGTNTGKQEPKHGVSQT